MQDNARKIVGAKSDVEWTKNRVVDRLAQLSQEQTQS